MARRASTRSRSSSRRRFPPQKITVEELGHFVGMLHRNGLVIANVAGQGEQLQQAPRRAEVEGISGRGQQYAGPALQGHRSRSDSELALSQDAAGSTRVPARDRAARCWLPSALLAGAGAVRQVPATSCPRSTSSSKPRTGFIWASRWRVTKVIHEFGHGLTCKHFGGECHEMGVMFLVLTPCLYCNVSDSWMLPNKWHRAWIGAAGMYVELVIASICTFLWWFSEPGLLQSIVLEHDVRLLGQHGDVQRQSAVALRRLLHPVRPDGNSRTCGKSRARFSTASWAPGAWGWKSPTIRFCRSATSCFSRSTPSPRPFIAG